MRMEQGGGLQFRPQMTSPPALSAAFLTPNTHELPNNTRLSEGSRGAKRYSQGYQATSYNHSYVYGGPGTDFTV